MVKGLLHWARSYVEDEDEDEEEEDKDEDCDGESLGTGRTSARAERGRRKPGFGLRKPKSFRSKQGCGGDPEGAQLPAQPRKWRS